MTNAKPQLMPSRVLAVLLRSWWVLLLATIVGGVVAFGYSSTLAPSFQSTASTWFSMRTGTSGSDINQGSAYTQNQMLSFAQLSMSAIVLDEVRDELDLDLTNSQIRNMTSVSIPQNTVILDITAASTDPEFAAQLANSIANNLAVVVDRIAPKDDSGKTTIVADVIEPATPAPFQSSPNKQRDAVLGAFAGFLLAVTALAIWALLDTRVRSEEVLRRVTDLPVLGGIPIRKDKSRRPVVMSDPNGTSAEAYRRVRSSLRFSAVEHQITAIAVTSSIPGEGKTSTAVNIALTYAEAGMRVLLVDADLRRPMVAETLGLENAVGLTSMLVGAVEFEEAHMQWGESSLWVLPAGEVPPNPAELLASARMAELLGRLRREFDIMIVDTAPLLSVSDATIIAQHVDSTILVADVTKVRIAQLSRSLDALDVARTQVAGVLLSRVRRQRGDDYNYYHYGTSDRRRRRSGPRAPHREGGAQSQARHSVLAEPSPAGLDERIDEETLVERVDDETLVERLGDETSVERLGEEVLETDTPAGEDDGDATPDVSDEPRHP